MTRPIPQDPKELAALLREHVNALPSVIELLRKTARQCRVVAPTPQSRKPGVHALAIRAESIAAYYENTVLPALHRFGSEEGSENAAASLESEASALAGTVNVCGPDGTQHFLFPGRVVCQCGAMRTTTP